MNWQADCSYQARVIQAFHIESRGWADIAYNFLVGGDGAIYVGVGKLDDFLLNIQCVMCISFNFVYFQRGWDYAGAHTKGQNFKSICFAFIGSFNTEAPPKHQLIAAQRMIMEGVRLKKLTADYALYGHRQFFATLSPGNVLYDIIKTWNHWTDEIRNGI